jgi:hypothetical protein
MLPTMLAKMIRLSDDGVTDGSDPRATVLIDIDKSPAAGREW